MSRKEEEDRDSFSGACIPDGGVRESPESITALKKAVDRLADDEE